MTSAATATSFGPVSSDDSVIRNAPPQCLYGSALCDQFSNTGKQSFYAIVNN